MITHIIPAHRLSWVFIIFLIFPFPSGLNAEAPPWYYKKLKEDASELVQIEILSVEKIPGNECLVDLAYKAKILKVFHSDSNLQINDTILIHSWEMTNSTACAGGGPQPPDLLFIGWVGNAYLNTKDPKKKEFDIAAFKESFETIEQEFK